MLGDRVAGLGRDQVMAERVLGLRPGGIVMAGVEMAELQGGGDMAGAGRVLQQLFRLARILEDVASLQIDHRQLRLGVAVARFGRLLQEFDGAGRVARPAGAGEMQLRQLDLGVAQALVRRKFAPAQRLFQVLPRRPWPC